MKGKIGEIILSLIVVLVLGIILQSYIRCKTTGGIPVQGFFTIECILPQQKDEHGN